MRLQLFALAYNPGNFRRRLALPLSISHWSLRTLQTKLIKIRAKVVRHARYTCFQMAKVSIPPGSVRGHPEAYPPTDSAGAGVTIQPLSEIDGRIRDREGNWL